jgi:3-dehydroquinate dehydratase I
MACAIDAPPAAAHLSAMAIAEFSLAKGRASVAGSFGGAEDLRLADARSVREACDIAEIRLDLQAADSGIVENPAWRHLAGIPLLFTARRGDEGGAGDLSAAARIGMLETAVDDAACIDIEVVGIPEMSGLLDTLQSRGIPWIASFHDFSKLPETAVLADAARRALDAGAAAFKVAAMLHSPADMARLADFQLADHGIPVATMGMGPLAPVSRLLCAQCGSVLNYGYLGETPTAPGQWDAGFLKQAISRLAQLSCG